MLRRLLTTVINQVSYSVLLGLLLILSTLCAFDTSVNATPDEIKFVGTALEQKANIGVLSWVVRVDQLLSGPAFCPSLIEVIVGGGVLPIGYVDPSVRVGDRVEVYGEVQVLFWDSAEGGGVICTVFLPQSYHYFKKSAGPDPCQLDSDRDGVPDCRDRCANTPSGTRVDEFGCPAQPLQYNVLVQVSDAATGGRLSGATVALDGNWAATTNANGEATITVSPGSHEIAAWKEGYDWATVQSYIDHDTTIRISLKRHVGDSDGDGLPDDQDRCPNEPGPRENNGCPRRPLGIIYVDDSNTSGIEDGTEQHPYNTIQEGLAAATSGSTVRVKAGIYHENIRMKGGVNLEGAGWDSTIIDGNGQGHVIYADSSVTGGKITGFTIRNGGSGWYDSGIWCEGCSLVISENRVDHNGGRGISAYTRSTVTITRNIITNNGISGVYCFSSSTEIINNTIDGNVKEAGITAHNARSIIKNNIITNNPSGILGLDNVSGLLVSYNDVWGNGTNYSSNIPLGQGNISSDPLFRSRSGGDYNLTSGSPCIDAGDPSMGNHPKSGNRYDMGALEYLGPTPPSRVTAEFVGDCTVNSGTYKAGDRVGAECKVKNTGPAQAEFVVALIVRAPNGQTYQGVSDREPIGPGQTYTFRRDADDLVIQVKSDWPAGLYDARLELKNYYTGEVYDIWPSWGWKEDQFTVVSETKKPDLVISDSDILVSWSGQVIATVSAVVRNIGEADANNVAVLFEAVLCSCSTDECHRDPKGSGAISTLSIPKGGQQTFSAGFAEWSQPGFYRKVTVKVDWQNLIAETNENNNEASKTFSFCEVNRPPTLENGKVQPAEGYAENCLNKTTFVFSVVYKDADGDEPATRIVKIRAWKPSVDKTLVMSKVSGDIKTGALYSVSTTLPEARDYIYWFYFDDGKGHSAEFPPKGQPPADGPIVIGCGNQPPKADFSFRPTQPKENELVQFTDKSSDPDGKVTSWSWDFSDGATSTSQNPTHSYSTAKTYTVCLTVTDDDGATGKACKDITIIPQVGAKFEYSDLQVSPTQVTPGQSVTASATVKNVGNASGIATAELKVDGQVRDSKGVFLSSGQSQRVSFAFSFSEADIGDHQVTIDDLAAQEVRVEGKGPSSKTIAWAPGSDPLCGMSDQSGAGCARFVNQLRQAGYTVEQLRRTTSLIPALDVTKQTVYVVIPVSFIYDEATLAAQAKAVEDYVSQGGNLLVLYTGGGSGYEYTRFSQAVAQRFGVTLHTGVEYVYNDYQNCGRPTCPLISIDPEQTAHAIAKDVSKIYASSPSFILGHGSETTVIASTSTDSNTNCILTECKHIPGSHKIVAYRQTKNGGRVVFADASIFANRMIEKGDNSQLGLNIINWLAGSGISHLMGGASIEEAIARLVPNDPPGVPNPDNYIGDQEILKAQQMWINGSPVPGTDGKVIDDAMMLKLLGIWSSRRPVSQPSGAPYQSGDVVKLSVEKINLAPNPVKSSAMVTLKAEGTGIASLKVEVFNLAGMRVFEQEVAGNTIRFYAVDNRGRPLANGVYLYVVRVRGYDGREYLSEVRKLIIVR